ncbi:MAG TPA: AEC family transporter, partial [Thermodesulfobacteriota bacterium]|nr:AEC family transporter [Thermodesulfobacteriota bacterium]
NIFAVYALARQQNSHLGRELITNPLVIATVSGLLSNILGLSLWPPLAAVIQRMGNASLALGVLCIGAGLTFAQWIPAAGSWVIIRS